MNPEGHTISVSDIWLVAHAYGALSTIRGEVEAVEADGVRTADGAKIPCDLIVKCTGFHRQDAARSMLGADLVHANNVVRPNLVYAAESILDDVGGYKTPFGSSYVEAIAMGVSDTVHTLVETGRIDPQGPTIDIVDARVSWSIEQMATLHRRDPRAFERARQRVSQRCVAFHRRFDPLRFRLENAREWDDMCRMFEARSATPRARPRYPFSELIDRLAPEWRDPAYPIGNLADLATHNIEVHGAVASWVDSVEATAAAASRLNSKQQAVSGNTIKADDVQAWIIAEVESQTVGDHDPITSETVFLDLGMDSLAMTSFLVKLNGRFGADLSITALFDYDSVASLASHIATGKTTDTIQRPKSHSEEEEPLLCLRPCTNNASAATICIHGADGRACGHELIDQLDPAAGVYAIQAPEAAGARYFESLVTRASYYAALLAKRLPGTELCLVGWSLGGVLAELIAREFDRTADGPACSIVLADPVPYRPVQTSRTALQNRAAFVATMAGDMISAELALRIATRPPISDLELDDAIEDHCSETGVAKRVVKRSHIFARLTRELEEHLSDTSSPPNPSLDSPDRRASLKLASRRTAVMIKCVDTAFLDATWGRSPDGECRGWSDRFASVDLRLVDSAHAVVLRHTMVGDAITTAPMQRCHDV